MFAGTKILIAGGEQAADYEKCGHYVVGFEKCSKRLDINRIIPYTTKHYRRCNADCMLYKTSIYNTCYLLEVNFLQDSNEVKKVRYRNVPNIPTPNICAFSARVEGRSIVGGGFDSNLKILKESWELDKQVWTPLPSLNVPRCGAVSCYLNKTLIVGGGHANGILDSIEILPIETTDNTSEWKMCTSTLPYRLAYHTMTHFGNKLILIGGYTDYLPTKRVWEGTLDTEHKRYRTVHKITWKEIPSMAKERSYHFSFAVDDKIYVVGGDDIGDDFIEIFDGREWKEGPRLSFSDVSTKYAQAVFDRKKRIIITTNDHGIIVYDPIQGVIKNYPNFKLREERRQYMALLQ